MDDTSMPEKLQQMQEVQAQLKKLGIPLEKVEELEGVINAYVDAKEEIIKARDSQFREDAYELLTGPMKAYTAKNGDVFARFLRRFAEHVIEQSQGLDKTISTPADIVDRIPTMVEASQSSQQTDEE